MPVLALALTGCGDDSRDRAVAEVVRRFTAAVDAKDGAGACALLAPGARAALERDAGTSCAAAVLGEDLPAPGSHLTVQVYGTAAQVRTGADTMFLGRFDRGWRITATGCAADGDRPYECVVHGG